MQRPQPHERVFRGIWRNSLHLSRFRVSHKHTLIPKSLLSLFQFQTARKSACSNTCRAGGLKNRSCTVHVAKKGHLNVNGRGVQAQRVQYLCACASVCVCVFVTPCVYAAALPAGIHSFRHIFTSSAFKGINIAPGAVAGLNG